MIGGGALPLIQGTLFSFFPDLERMGIDIVTGLMGIVLEGIAVGFIVMGQLELLPGLGGGL